MGQNAVDIDVRGPIVDEETGVRSFTLTAGNKIVNFGVAPQPSEDGITRWVMRFGSDWVLPGDFSDEPYDSLEEAFDAGLRAGQEALTREMDNPQESDGLR